MSNEMSVSGPQCRLRLEVSGGFLLLLSVSGFLWGGAVLAAAALAAAIHELGHLVLILLQGALPSRLLLDFSGACLSCAGREPSRREELLRALAGPAAGLLLCALLRASPQPILQRTASLSLMLSLVNLLPASGLDGGRALECILSPLGVLWPETLLSWLSLLSALFALCLGAFHSPQLFLYGIWLLLRAARIRRPD
jgi:stage IV sporulation protein FB